MGSGADTVSDRPWCQSMADKKGFPKCGIDGPLAWGQTLELGVRCIRGPGSWTKWANDLEPGKPNSKLDCPPSLDNPVSRLRGVNICKHLQMPQGKLVPSTLVALQKAFAGTATFVTYV